MDSLLINEFIFVVGILAKAAGDRSVLLFLALRTIVLRRGLGRLVLAEKERWDKQKDGQEKKARFHRVSSPGVIARG